MQRKKEGMDKPYLMLARGTRRPMRNRNTMTSFQTPKPPSFHASLETLSNAEEKKKSQFSQVDYEQAGNSRIRHNVNELPGNKVYRRQRGS